MKTLRAFLVAATSLVGYTTMAQMWGNTLAIGDEVCVEGYLMDYWCIQRGVLVENEDIVTLSSNGPIDHTVHCILDVADCVASAFEILLPSPDDDTFIRGWRLSETTKEQVIALAKAEGVCSDGCTGNIETGFHLGLRGTVVDLGDAGTPPTVQLISGWSAVGALRTSDPSGTMASDFVCGLEGSDYPPNQVTAFPTAAPTLPPTGSPTLDSAPAPEPAELQAFSTSVGVSGDVTVDFEVDPQESAVEVTVTRTGTGWLGVGTSPDGRMIGATACIAKGDGNPPQLYSLTSKSSGGEGILPATTQNLISSSFTQENGESILKCKIPVDLGSDSFSFSTTEESRFIVAYGDSNEFGYHSKSFANQIAPALQPSNEFGVGDTICVEGYLMDSLCINKGTLVDNPTVATLSVDQEGPIVHSVKCIVSVPACLESPFHIVPRALANADYYDQGWRLDDAAKEVAIQAAYANGVCEEKCSGDQETGLYVSMQAKVLSLGSNAEPALITTDEIQIASPDDNVCPFVARPPFPLPRVGDEVCIEGFVMDVFCINRGTLFDNRSVETLSPEGPVVHSVHCLIDVAECVASPFEILLPSLEDGGDFIRGWRLDEDTKADVVALAKAEGVCTDCEGSGTIERGFHVTFTGRIVDEGTADTPPTVTGVSSISVNKIEDDNYSPQCEGGSARPAPFADIPDDGGDDVGANGINVLRDGLTLQITDNGDQTATYVLTYEGEAWIAMAVSPNGQMIGSQAVIGLPDSGEDPVIHTLGAKVTSGIQVADTQILTSSSVTQEGGTTVLTFTVPLETDGFRVSAEGETGYLYAFGDSNTFGYHAARSPFSAALEGGISAAKDPTNYYKVHGILMALAWGVLCPMAIGASLLRNFFPPGMFFQIHRALNSLVVLLTLIAFAVAVRATNIENLDHFAEVTHRKLGLAIFLFAFLQACNGALRPHLPHKPEDDENAELPPKSTARKIWEVAHRGLGFSILIMAWANCTSGIEQYSLKFDADKNKWTAVFWTITGIIAGVVLVSYVGVTAKKLTVGEGKEKREGEREAMKNGDGNDA